MSIRSIGCKKSDAPEQPGLFDTDIKKESKEQPISEKLSVKGGDSTPHIITSGNSLLNLVLIFSNTCSVEPRKKYLIPPRDCAFSVNF